MFPRIIEEYAEKHFEQKPLKCKRCNHEEFWGYDIQRRLFCKLLYKDVYVYLKRYECKKCSLVQYGNELFYSHCLYSRPIVDMCLYLSAKNPYDRVETIMMNFGIQVDGDTVKNYALYFKNKVDKIAGLKFCHETIGINLLKILFNVENVKELKEKYKIKEGIESVIDETYPAKKGAKKKLKEDKETQKNYPEGFTLGMSYLPFLMLFASMICRDAFFNYGEARALVKPLEGTDYNLTDGNPSYSFVKNRQRCLVHKCRNERKRDKVFQDLKSASQRELRKYCHDKYIEKKKMVEKEFKDGKFIGAISTNSIEGGNFRVKYELRTPYWTNSSIYARTIQLTILESVRTFCSGKPIYSFGAINSNFTYSNIMSLNDREDKMVERYHYDMEKKEWYLSLERVM